MDDALTELRRIAERELAVPARLHEYQWEGVAFLYKSSSALLGDEMGLGKTVQAAVALALLHRADNGIHRSLIVAPSSLTLNWMSELERWAPSLTVRRVQGEARSREAYYLLPIPVLVASYDHIRLDGLDRIPPDTFQLVVLDEAQRIKNVDATTALACRLLPRTRAWALSATPLENSEADLESILSFLDGRMSSGLSRAYLRAELKTKMLRRRKLDVRAELPPVLMQDLSLDLSDEQRESYDQLWLRRLDEVGGSADGKGVSLFALLTRLKMICNYDQASAASSKCDALRAILESAGEEARIIVFSQFVDTLEWLSERLEYPHELLTGAMALEKRRDVTERFRFGSCPRALLISLRAGGVGLNLGEASHVVLFDRWWNPAVEKQAVFRAHRFERTMPLHVVRFLVRDSIEERIASLLRTKERLFEDVVESAESNAYGLTMAELLSILDIDPLELRRIQSRSEEESDGQDHAL